MNRAFVFGLSVLALACGACQPGGLASGNLAIELDQTLAPFTIPALAPPGDSISRALQTSFGVSFPRDRGITSVHLSTLVLRSVPDASPAADGSVPDRAHYTAPCTPGDASLAFVHALQVRIQVVNHPATSQLLATYARDPSGQDDPAGPCVLRLIPDRSIDLQSFLPDYEFMVDFTGVAPSQTVYIGGYTTASVNGHFGVP